MANIIVSLAVTLPLAFIFTGFFSGPAVPAGPECHVPVAVNDTYTIMESFLLEVPPAGVLGNDTDQEGLVMTTALLAAPQHGDLVLNADGSFTYTPAPGWYGEDLFTYHAVNAYGPSTLPAEVALTVEPLYRVYTPLIAR